MPWSQQEQSLLDGAYASVPKELPSKERWKAIAEVVGNGRTARECAERVKELRQLAKSSAAAYSEAQATAAEVVASPPVPPASASPEAASEPSAPLVSDGAPSPPPSPFCSC